MTTPNNLAEIVAGLSKAHIDALNGEATADMPSQVALDFIKWKLIRPVMKYPFTTDNLATLTQVDLTIAWSERAAAVRTYLQEHSQ